jgi:hypothetical protein
MGTKQEVGQVAMHAAIRTLRNFIEKRDQTQNHLVFLTKHGSLDSVSGDDWTAIAEEARARSGGPHFDILSICADGRLITGQSVEEYLVGNIIDYTLGRTIGEALDAYETFYKERAEEFGPGAYPKGAAVGK